MHTTYSHVIMHDLSKVELAEQALHLVCLVKTLKHPLRNPQKSQHMRYAVTSCGPLHSLKPFL